MIAGFPLTSIVSAIAGAKARQLRRDAMLLGFVCLMSVMATALLFGAFALFVAESYGLMNGLLAAAGLALALIVLAGGVRSLLRLRARRRMRVAMASNVSALAVTSASSAIASNKATAIVAGLVIGAVAGSLVRSDRG
jgi:O-antigen/teichoic acid export membrane protein